MTAEPPQLGRVTGAAAATAAIACIAIAADPRLATLVGGAVLLVAGFAVMAPCQLQMAVVLGGLGEAQPAAGRRWRFALGYLAFYAAVALLVGTLVRVLGSLAWVAILAGAVAASILGLAVLGRGRPRSLARCRGPLRLLSAGWMSAGRPVRAGSAYGSYCASCCWPYTYALAALAGGTRSLWLGVGLTGGYAAMMVTPVVLLGLIAPATSRRLAARAAPLHPVLQRATGLMLIGLGILLVPAALAGAAG